MTEHLFKEGDKALAVRRGSWGGVRHFRIVEIGKVHKTGRLTLTGDKKQWSFTRGFGDEQSFFTEAGQSWRGERLYVWSDDLVNEITAEREAQEDRVKLNKVGEAISRIRDNNQGAELWTALPDDFKSLIEA